MVVELVAAAVVVAVEEAMSLPQVEATLGGV